MWVSGRERRKLCTCLLSAPVSVPYERNNSHVLDSTPKQRDALLILRCLRHTRACWPAARPAKAVATARIPIGVDFWTGVSLSLIHI